MDYPFDLNIPERLYKYTPACSAVKILMANKIRFTLSAKFNDPFDGLLVPDLETLETRKLYIEELVEFVKNSGLKPISDSAKKNIINDPEFANKYAREFIEHLVKNQTTGFCCFSQVKDSLPMWAHYADNHAGCCLIFDFSNYTVNLYKFFPFIFMKKIKYCNDLPKYSIINKEPIYGYKSDEWAYEKEWRAVMYDCSIDEDFKTHRVFRKCKGPRLYNLSKNILHGVILGCRMTDSDKEKVIKAARHRKIKIYQAAPKLYQYGMKIDQIQE